MIAIYKREAFNLSNFISWEVKPHGGPADPADVTLISMQAFWSRDITFHNEEAATAFWEYLNKISTGFVPLGTSITSYLKDE